MPSMKELLTEARDVLLRLSNHPAFEDDAPEFNEGGYAHTMCGKLREAMDRPDPDAALDRIQFLMSENEWNSEVTDWIADAVRTSGREIKDYPPEDEAPDDEFKERIAELMAHGLNASEIHERLILEGVYIVTVTMVREYMRQIERD